MKELSTKEIMEMQDAGVRNLYIRWSRGPKYDKRPSRDYISGVQHVGLSAVYIDYWEYDLMVRRLKEYEFLRIKDASIAPYIYRGNEIGKDSDGYSSISLDCVCLGKWKYE